MNCYILQDSLYDCTLVEDLLEWDNFEDSSKYLALYLKKAQGKGDGSMAKGTCLSLMLGIHTKREGENQFHKVVP